MIIFWPWEKEIVRPLSYSIIHNYGGVIVVEIGD
jgi:hypothetical protein